MTKNINGLTAQGDALPKNSHPLSELLPIHQQDIGGKLIQAVNARELHALGRDFSTRVQEQIGVYRFIEGLDYTVVETLSAPNSGSAKARLSSMLVAKIKREGQA